MKFASFRVAGRNTFGVALSDDVIIDIKASAKEKCPKNLIGLIRMGEAGILLVNEILQHDTAAVGVTTGDIEWDSPIRRPGKICGVAMNNSANISDSCGIETDAETRHELKEEPVEMIGAECEYQIRVEFFDGLFAFRVGFLQGIPVVGCLVEAIQQRTMRGAGQESVHRCL